MSETRPIIRGTVGCVSSSNYMATTAGFTVLLAGGNAFDVAAATGLALHVVEPHMNGIGGEAPTIVYSSKRKKAIAISGQGYAPGSASIDFFRAQQIELIPGDGFLPATVPASLDLWITLLIEFGTMTLAEVMRPALRLAENGFPVYPTLARSIRAHAKRFASEWPTTARVYLPNGRSPEVGEKLVQKDLANTLRNLVHAERRAGGGRLKGLAAARDYFYSGPVAKQIVRFASENPIKDATGEAHTGLIDLPDLAEFHTRLETPVSMEYSGLRVHKCGPWSQGPVFLQQLRLLEGYDLRRLGHNTPDYIHILTEASKLAFADRERYYGDPRFADVPMQRLLSRSYAAKRRKLINLKKASLGLRPGTIPSRKTPCPSDSHGDTTHLDVADSEGNMVSVTASGGWIWGSPVIAGLGFPLGTRGEMFSLDKSHPNCIAPHKRPRTTLSPTLVTLQGKPYLAFGTPGGDQQDQWTLQFFLNFVEFGMNLQFAIDAPTFHNSHFPSSFYPRMAEPGVLHVEGRIPSVVRTALKRRGHRIVVDGNWVNGRVTAVHIDEGGTIEAAASSRYQTAYAMGQ
jgi:gamma-glutamyltranspeptidase/glutathione hydrolase